jgi:hypothetical protein
MPNEANVTLNDVTMTRIRNFAARAKARGDERSNESWAEELMDFAVTEMQRRWVSSDKYHNRNKFADDIVKLGVMSADGSIKNPQLLQQLVQKYGITQGTQKQI